MGGEPVLTTTPLRNVKRPAALIRRLEFSGNQWHGLHELPSDPDQRGYIHQPISSRIEKRHEFIKVRLPLIDRNQKDFCKDRRDISRIEQSSCASQHGKLCSLRIQFQKVDARHARLRAESI